MLKTGYFIFYVFFIVLSLIYFILDGIIKGIKDYLVSVVAMFDWLFIYE
jgi:hypothetical protein